MPGRADETEDDRITVRTKQLKPFIVRLAEADDRSVSDWVKRELAKVIKRRVGFDPTKAKQPSAA